MKFRKSDYVIISIICFFLGIALVSQVYAGRNYKKVSQPENNEVIALEVAKLTKSNADLRRTVQDLTRDLDTYNDSSEMQRNANTKYQSDLNRLAVINGESSASGQGVILTVSGKLASTQIIDLINAIKNIGSETISINSQRLTMQTDLAMFAGLPQYEIKILGNSNLLKSAMERKGGIVEQISSKDISISIAESANMTIEGGKPLELVYARAVNDQ